MSDAIRRHNRRPPTPCYAPVPRRPEAGPTQAVVDAAMPLLLAGGYDETTTGAIADEAWVDVAEPSHAFAGRFSRTAAEPSSPLSPVERGVRG